MQASILYFDQFELDLNSYELRKSGRVIKLERLPMELLILWAEKQGQLVTREQIIQRLWGDDVFVDTRQGINTAIRKIRVALHDDPEHPRLLQTLAGRGYRLLAPVSTGGENGHEQPLPQLPLASSFPPSIQPVSAVTAVRWRYVVVVAIVLLVTLASAIFWHSRRQAAHPPTEQRVTSNPPDAPIKFAVVSPDGKYVAYADSTGLYLRQISSGETHPWSVPKDFIASPNSWFPDSTHLLVTRSEGASRIPSLWKLSLLGGSPLKLMDNAAAGAVSPEGSRIAYMPGPKFGSELWLMDSDGANPRKIAAAEKPDEPVYSGIFPVVWSRNGQRIAYIERHAIAGPEPAEGTFSLETRDANGGDPQVVLKDDPRLGSAVWWAADGRILYPYRDNPMSERGDQGVYSILVDERAGKAMGQPQLLTKGPGRIGGLSTTSDGKRLVLWRMNTEEQAFLAEFEAGSRRLRAQHRLTIDANGNIAEAWTSDSKSVLFVSNRNGTWKLFKQNIDETTAEVLVEGRSIFLPRLSGDGSQVLYLAASKPGDISFPASLMSKYLAGGHPRLVLHENGITNYQCARTPSQLCIFSKLVGTNHIFASFDIEHGAGRELTRTTSGFTNWTMSPDGTELAIFLDQHRIRFFSPSTGVAHDVIRSIFAPALTPPGGSPMLFTTIWSCSCGMTRRISSFTCLNTSVAVSIRVPTGGRT
jgi:DNA-binding winged helix-turn-helix (wHTH) protein/Tol biopolymer transport system component